MALHLLHGTLLCTIHRAVDLKNEFRISGAAPILVRKMIESVEGAVRFGRGPSRLYATVDLEKARVGRSRIIEHEPVNPVWNECFHIYCAHFVSNIVISVKDDDRFASHVLGRAIIPVKYVLAHQAVEDWFELFHSSGRAVGRIRVTLQFMDVRQDPFWGRGIADGYNFPGVPFTYFPQRKSCKMILYQDAHTRDRFLPRIYLSNNQLRQSTRCWEDLYMAISNAHHFIYIAGWSVYPEITLVRDLDRSGPGREKLGELLKRKANEGVTVLLLVWDDRTSNAVRRDGLMATHDEETLEYFRNTNVCCVLCPRNPDDAASVVQGFQLGTMFTHHQKLVCVDSPHPVGNMRRVVSFVGGLDLCDGRYDDQRHSLFRTLQGEHENDFYQGCIRGAKRPCGGPREPWHDIHVRLEGSIAWDVLENFEQRWKKQGIANALLDLTSTPFIIPSDQEEVAFQEPDTWNIQLFRSIDGGAAFGFPDSPLEAARMGLVSGKDKVIERSIQDAYIHAIRRANRFIYIENQYFLGSSHAWGTPNDTGCLHLIPIELALKIVSKIEAGERFSVYVVIPMWPEGQPDSNSVQAILDWQQTTMEMMYKQIAQALRAKGINNESPTDYLSFFCLGNRESKKGSEYLPSLMPEDSFYKLAQENRRLMIYVHSKMMIVDDEYILVGSANINQRSMDGGRDSEIAVGGYQPSHTGIPYGQIHGFRLSLWYEHLGRLDNIFLKPWTLQCMREVNQIAIELWENYAAPESSPLHDLPGHLLSYPVVVAQDGALSHLPGYPTFPDTKASVLGCKSTVLPPILTT